MQETVLTDESRLFDLFLAHVCDHDLDFAMLKESSRGASGIATHLHPGFGDMLV